MGGLGQVNTLMPIDKDTFCVAPWFRVFVDSDKKIAPCCLFKETQYNYNQIDEYFNSDHINDVRNDLLNGVKNKNCAKCWHTEKNGHRSLRKSYNENIVKRLDYPLQEQIKKPELSKVISFDITLGNLCNLKCIMCNPGLSSQILAEAIKHPALKDRYNGPHSKKNYFNYNQKEFDWSKGEEFVEWCNRYLPKAIHIRFTGGEPFINPQFLKFLDSISDEQKKKCILDFTTNLTVVNDKILEYFAKFKEVWLSVSVEGHGGTHEYLRYGHSWDKLCENISTIKKIKEGNLSLSINHVVQAPSYHSIIEMTNFFDDQLLKITPLFLTDPKHFHISALTKKAKQKFIKDTDGYNGFNKEFIQFVRAVSIEHMDQDMQLTKSLVDHLSQFDRVRGNSYKKIIPNENII